MGKYFGTDGFRGRANETLTAAHAFKVGRILGSRFGKEGERAKIVVGKDTRRSSYMLEYALASGIVASGADAYLLHVTTTPSVSYVVKSEGFDCGVMISASHNPYDDNGLKLISRTGEKMDDELLQCVEQYLDGEFALPLATGSAIGRTVDFTAGRNRYLGYLLSLPRTSFRGMRVGLDCANGSAWAISKAVFDALGADVCLTGAEPDGTNINLGCGSTHPERLQALVREKKLDAGFAFDGDADRCICVDERGEIVDGDGILYLSAKRMKEKGELEQNGVSVTVMSNSGLVRSLAREGIFCAVTPVGDRFVYEEMLARGFSLGGEQSGHIIFRKYASTGDGVLTSLMVMETMLGAKCPLSVLTEGLALLPQKTKSVRVRDKAVVGGARVREAVAAAQELLKEGRLLLRPSGTEPVVRILAEGNACLDEAIALVQCAVEKEGGVCAGS